MTSFTAHPSAGNYNICRYYRGHRWSLSFPAPLPGSPSIMSETKKGGHARIGFVKPNAAASQNRQTCWQQTQTWLNKWFTPTSLDFHSNALGYSEKVLYLQWTERTLPAAISPRNYKEELSALNNKKLAPFILLSSAPAYINSKGRSIPDKHLKKAIGLIWLTTCAEALSDPYFAS